MASIRLGFESRYSKQLETGSKMALVLTEERLPSACLWATRSLKRQATVAVDNLATTRLAQVVERTPVVELECARTADGLTQQMIPLLSARMVRV